MAAAAASAVALGSPSVATKTVKFSGTYAGRAVVLASGDTADIQATATGTGTPVGKSKWSGKGLGRNAQPCPTFVGNAVLTAADGSTLKFSVRPGAKACPRAEDDKLNDVTGTAVFKGGTGKYAKARGSFRFTGVYDRGRGTFTVKFVGKLTY